MHCHVKNKEFVIFCKYCHNNKVDICLCCLINSRVHTDFESIIQDVFQNNHFFLYSRLSNTEVINRDLTKTEGTKAFSKMRCKRTSEIE